MILFLIDVCTFVLRKPYEKVGLCVAVVTALSCLPALLTGESGGVDGPGSTPPEPAPVQAIRLEEGGPHHGQSAGHFVDESLVAQRVFGVLRRKHDRFPPELRKEADPLQRPLDADPARRREVVRDEEQPSHRPLPGTPT